MIFHENRLSADDSHERSCLICYIWKSGKIWNRRLLQIIGGALWVNVLLGSIMRDNCAWIPNHIRRMWVDVGPVLDPNRWTLWYSSCKIFWEKVSRRNSRHEALTSMQIVKVITTNVRTFNKLFAYCSMYCLIWRCVGCLVVKGFFAFLKKNTNEYLLNLFIFHFI